MTCLPECVCALGVVLWLLINTDKDIETINSQVKCVGHKDFSTACLPVRFTNLFFDIMADLAVFSPYGTYYIVRFQLPVNEDFIEIKHI